MRRLDSTAIEQSSIDHSFGREKALIPDSEPREQHRTGLSDRDGADWTGCLGVETQRAHSTRCRSTCQARG